MTIDMDRFRQVTGTQLQPQAAPLPSPYEGKSFLELATKDIPRWRSAMDLSIQKGDLGEAQKFNDLIEGAASEFKDDWLSFTQFKGNHPVGALMRETSAQLLSGNLGQNAMNAALGDKAVRDRAITFSYGNGALGSLVATVNDQAADPMARSIANQKLQALNLPADPVGSPRVRTIKDPVTGQERQVREQQAPLDPTTRDSKEAHLNFLNAVEAQHADDPDFMKSVGGVTGLGAMTGNLLDAGGSSDAATAYMKFVDETTVMSNLSGPEKAAAFKSTANMLTDLSRKFNQGKDPVRSMYITKALEKSREVLGADNFSMKGTAVEGAMKLAFGLNEVALQASGSVADPEKFSVIVSAFAKRNARNGQKIEDDEQVVLDAYDQSNALKGGITLGANPGMEPGQELFSQTVGADGKPVMQRMGAMGGVGSEHNEAKQALTSVIDNAAAVSAVTGQPFNDVFRDRMKTEFADQILGRTGGRLPPQTADYDSGDPQLAQLMKNPPEGAKITTRDDGRIVVAMPERRMTREAAEGLAGLAAKVFTTKGTFNVNNVMGEIASLPEIANELKQEVATADARSFAEGKTTRESKQATEIINESVKSPVTRSIVQEINSSVTGKENDWLSYDTTTVRNKMLGIVKSKTADSLKAAMAPGSTAFNAILDGVDSQEQLARIVEGSGDNSIRTAARNAFIEQVRQAVGPEAFSSPDADAKLQSIAEEYVRGMAKSTLRYIQGAEIPADGWTRAGGVRNLIPQSGLSKLTPEGFSYDPGTKKSRYDMEVSKDAIGEGGRIMSPQERLSEDLNVMVLNGLVGGDPLTMPSGQRIASQFRMNMLTRTPISQTEEQATAQGADQVADLSGIDQYVSLDKTSLIDVVSAAQIYDARNDEAVTYRSKEGMVARLSKSLPEYSEYISLQLRDKLAKEPNMSSKALYEEYDKVLGSQDKPGTIRYEVLQRKIKEAEALAKARKVEESVLAAEPPPAQK